MALRVGFGAKCGLTPRSSGAPTAGHQARAAALFIIHRAGLASCRRRYSRGMAPTIVRDGQFRLFFFSREESRIHVHVAHPDGEAKFWLTPEVHLAVNVGLTQGQVRQAHAVVEAHLKEIQDAWVRHFGS